MQDYLIRAVALKGKVRAFAAYTKNLTEELRTRHQTSPVATATLGRTATAALMMGAMLKGDEHVTVQIKGGGPIGQIVAQADANGFVRGYVDNPNVDLPLDAIGKLDVAGAVGTNGFLNIIKDLGLKEPYRGSIPIVSGELAEDFTYYFAKSEQTPTVTALGVLVDRDRTVKTAGGFIIQLLPGVKEDEIAELEEALGKISAITALLDRGDTLEDILKALLPDVQVLERSDAVEFRCKCSRDRLERTLISIGKEELEQMAEEDGKAEITCHFCNERYEFSDEDIRRLIQQLS